MKNSSDDTYIEELKEWQDRQYTPGHFVGGKSPVWLRHPGKPKVLGIILVLPVLAFLFQLIYSLATKTFVFPTDPGEYIGFFMVLLAGAVGVKLILKKP